MLALVLILMIASQAFAVIVETASLKNFLFGAEPNCSYDNWTSHIAEGIASTNYNLYAPYDRQTNGFGNFQIPSATDMTNWGYVTDAFLAHDWDLAQDLINSYGYPFQVVQFNDTDSGRTYYMIREIPDPQYYDNNGTTLDTYDDEDGAFHYGWGLFIYNPAGNRPLIITVPHPCDDYPTPNVGYETFQLWNAKFLMINGAGREVRWTNVPPYTNAKSLSDPTRVANHPFNKSYQKFCDLIRTEFGKRELSVQHHTYDWNRHQGYASVQVSAGNARSCPNLPIRDLSGNGLDLISQGNHLMIPQNTHGTHANVYLNDYYTVYYNVHDFIFEEDGISYPVNNYISLPGAEGNQQMVYTLSGWSDYDVIDPFFHIEMDELPNSYEETNNYLKWFYGYNETTQRWDYDNLYTNFNNYYSRWWTDLESVLDPLFNMNDGVNPTNPTNLTVHSQSLNHVTLRWDRSYSYDFDTYEILYATEPIGLSNYQIFSRAQNQFLASQAYQQINVTGLTNSNTYYFRIRAKDKNGNYSAMSNEVMTSLAPANVTGLNAYGMDSINRLFWTVSGQTANQGFTIYKKIGEADYVLLDSWQTNPALSNPTATSFEYFDNFVSNGETYTYKISSTNNANMEFFYNFPATCSPRLIHTLTIKNSSETLTEFVSFSSNPYASDGQDTHYDVSRSTPSGSNYVWNAFWQQYWGNQGTHLSREIKGFFDADSQLKSWVMRTRSDLTNQTLTIQASDTFGRAEKLWLYDSGNATWHNLLSGPYNFNNTNSNVRTMTLYWGNMQPVVSHNFQSNRIYQGGTQAIFSWSTQYPFLVDHLRLSITNGTDSLWVASDVPVSTNSFTLNLPNDLNMPNAKFHVDAVAVDGVITRFSSSYTFGIVPSLNLMMTASGWNPRASIWNSSNFTVSQVFGDGSSALAMDEFGNWNPSTYFDFGKSYWVNVPDFSFFSSANPIQRDSLSFVIRGGWNLVPNPHLCVYEIKDLMFWINNIRYRYSEAISQQIISPAVYVYREGRYVLTDSIEPYESFLVKYYGGVNNPAQITMLPFNGAVEINTHTPQWQLDVFAAQASTDSDFIRLGANSLSSDGYEFRFDLPDPMAKPFESIQLYIARDEAVDNGFIDQSLKQEFRSAFPSATDSTKVWDIRLAVPNTDPVHFTFDQSLLPETYTATLWIDGVGHHLYNGNLFVFNPPSAGVFNGQIIVHNYPVGNNEHVQSPISRLKVYPNPFNPTTNIAFSLAKQEQVAVEIFNLRGQRVAILHDAILKSGSHQLIWQGKDDRGSRVGSGLYFVRIKTPSKTQTMKMMMLK